MEKASNESSATDEQILRIGIPSKGRLSELAEELLQQAGLGIRRQSRNLFARIKGMPVELTFLRTDDIPVLCAEAAIDMGITGSDLVAESCVDVDTRLKLGVGNCRLSVCVPIDGKIKSPQDLNGIRIATSFPNVTSSYLKRLNCKAHLVELSGSVEVMTTLGVADAIVDLVETGSTLAANRLRILEDIGSYETVLIENKTHQKKTLAARITRRLEGVLIARSYTLLEYNIPRARREEAELITPGFNSPTVNSLEDEDWCAIRAMVKRDVVIETMERLEAIGAKAILETRITNCRL
jgi:ATP phosphoribosyltransferase